MHWIIQKTINFFKKTPENPTALFIEKQDSLAAEVPVSLVYNGIAHTVMMCSPQDLEDFALGFSLAEGIIEKKADIYGIDVVEAEIYMDEALRLFPEDGYFLKYKGELLWMKGRCADALELFAQAREKTNNGITQLELDKFLNPYGKETVKTCQMLLDYGQKEGAMKLMDLWYRLLPDNLPVREYYYLSRANVAKTRQEMEELVKEVLQRIMIPGFISVH